MSDRADAARKAWITIRANRAKAGYVPKARSGKPRAAARRRVKSSFKPFAYHSHSQHWSTPKYKGAAASIRRPVYRPRALSPTSSKMKGLSKSSWKPVGTKAARKSFAASSIGRQQKKLFKRMGG